VAHSNILIRCIPIFNVALQCDSLYNAAYGTFNDRRGDELGGTGLRVLVVQDHPVLASANRPDHRWRPDLAVCGIAHSGADATALATREHPNVVLIDFHLPDMSGRLPLP